jgi:ribosomal protein S27E
MFTRLKKQEYYPYYLTHLADQDRTLPFHVQKEFDDYLKCGLLEHGFLRVRCEACSHERMVAFSCKHRGFCPSCCAKRMIESSALLIDSVFPYEPMRQWVLSVPYPLRFLFANHPYVMGKALKIVYRVISTYLIKKSGHHKNDFCTASLNLKTQLSDDTTGTGGARSHKMLHV